VDWTAGIPTSITPPTLVIWGERDPVFLPSLREGLIELCAQPSLCSLDNVGHNPLRDAPGPVAAAMQVFLGQAIRTETDPGCSPRDPERRR
jgi:pimeloyl-ACP methyl ester carboxylesterase